MGYFCTHCNINWSRLYDEDTSGDESYSFCPICKSDMYIKEDPENNIDLMWKPMCDPPTPVGFSSWQQWQDHLFSELLKEKGWTKKQFYAQVELNRQEKEREGAATRQEYIDNIIAEKEKAQDEYLKKYFSENFATHETKPVQENNSAGNDIVVKTIEPKPKKDPPKKKVELPPLIIQTGRWTPPKKL